ncbi:MAG: polysaccharide deacetylase family protein [Candidatus Hodarchaeota archaeon]
MITISIPHNFLPERIYIIDLFFNEFLGVNYRIIPKNIRNYELSLQNSKKLIINDCFFSNYGDHFEYLKIENIPSKVKYLKNTFLVEDNIPVIFGTDEMIISTKEIKCGIDIFASSFFMLSRWEEYVDKTRDAHNRFPVHASLAYKNAFLDRPIVNEYLEMLWNMLINLGYEGNRKTRSFKFIITHDIDLPLMWISPKLFIRNFAADLIKRHTILGAAKTMRSYILSKVGLENDPFDTFDLLMDLSEDNGAQSNFNLMSEGNSIYKKNYTLDDIFIRKLIKKILKRGHKIGFHPSYETYNNRELWSIEYKKLSSIIPEEIKTGRQHFLRFEVPITWQIWNDNRMTYDSTLNYPEKEGFRCGICYEYSIFNILSRKKLELKESPLIIMDQNFIAYQIVTSDVMLQKLQILMSKIKKYKGNFVILWHNSSFNVNPWIEYHKVYKRILHKKGIN